jgi:hypothetical protein
MINPTALTLAYVVALAAVSPVTAYDLYTPSAAGPGTAGAPMRDRFEGAPLTGTALGRRPVVVPDANSRNREDCMKTICARSEGGG